MLSVLKSALRHSYIKKIGSYGKAIEDTKFSSCLKLSCNADNGSNKSTGKSI